MSIDGTSFVFVMFECECYRDRPQPQSLLRNLSTPLAATLILRCLIVLQYLSVQKLKRDQFSFHLIPNHRKLSIAFVLSWLYSVSTCSCASSYKKSVLPYGKCAEQRLLCMRRKRVFLQLCVVLAILNFNSARKGSFVFQKSKWIAHNVRRFREDKSFLSYICGSNAPKESFMWK